jgi:CDP-glucose 4,6-dehydratase
MVTQLKNTYKGKKVFITGHTGFKGSWLLSFLSFLGADLKGYALAPTGNDDLYCLLDGDKLCNSVIGDLRDKEKLTSEILAFQPDFLFHLAAQPLVRLSYEMPADTFDVNVMGTVNVLDAVKQLEKKCAVVLITTDKVYHNNEWVYPYRETDRLGGYDPYSASKACAELVIDSYRNSFFSAANYEQHQKAIAVGRAGNVIGGGDWAKDRLLPDIARALAKEEPIVLRNPASVRPWQHVMEPITGYLLLGEKLAKDPLYFAQAYNFGPHAQDTMTVKEMVAIAIEKWGKGTYEVLNSTGQPHEAGLLSLDITKALKELEWSPRFNAVQAIEYTVNWYKQYLLQPDTIAAYTHNQIMHFMNG